MTRGESGMTLEEECRLSYYKKIADISTHKNVFLVQHVENGHIFVMKEQEVYCREVYEYLKECENPHVPRILECVEDNGKLIIVEEYVHGESLAEHLEKKGTYTLEEACRILITVCDVLEHLHNLRQPVIHRDLKPDNILIQENGYLKIIDFNTAKQYEDGQATDTVIIGTRKYAAPEQFGFCQSDARTDIYAMGVLMNYLLTKRYPDDYLYVSKSRGKRSATDIIQKCTEFSPINRYQTVAELRKDLQFVLFYITDGNYECSDRMEQGSRKGKKRWEKPYLPVGFRTGSIWKMVLGFLSYYFIFWMGLTLEVTRSDGKEVTAIYLWSNRLSIVAWLVLSIAFWGNYLGMQRKFPLMKHKYLRWVGCFLWPMIFLIACALICILIGG